jgi:hypothetical protein
VHVGFQIGKMMAPLLGPARPCRIPEGVVIKLSCHICFAGVCTIGAPNQRIGGLLVTQYKRQHPNRSHPIQRNLDMIKNVEFSLLAISGTILLLESERA